MRKVEIFMRFFLRTNSEKGTEKIMSKVESSLNAQFGIIECNKYWKNKKLYEITCKLTLKVKSFEEGVVCILTEINTFASGWVVSCPEKVDEETWSLYCSLSRSTNGRPKISGIEAVFASIHKVSPLKLDATL